MRCPKCGQVSRSGSSGVYVRSALFALKNNGVVTAAEFKELERSWMRYRAKHDLDPFGQKAETSRCGADGVDLCC